MSNFFTKLLGKDDDSTNHSHSHKGDVKCESETCSTSITGGEKHGRKSDSKITNINTDKQVIEGRTTQHEGVSVKSTVSSDVSSSISIANQQQLNGLISKLSLTHSEINDYASRQTAKIDEETQREIDQVVARTHHQQDELVQKASEQTSQIDAEHRARLQKMVEEIDADRAKRIAEIEKELNQLQAAILQAAKNDIDLLNKKAANLKIDILQDAQSKAALAANDITSQVSHLGQASTLHQSTGTTVIKTDVSAVSSAHETDNTQTIGKLAAKETHASDSGAQRI